MDAPADAFETNVMIRAEDVDEVGHVNNVTYVRWVQEAATAHWNARTSDAEKASVTWVVLRHEIDYLRAARPGDVVTAVTWVGPASRHAYERNTELRREGDGEPLARARTLWCPLDPVSGRPRRLEQPLRRRFSVEADGPGADNR